MHLLRIRVSLPPWSLSFGESLAFCLPIYSGTGHSLLLSSRGGIIPCRLGGRFQLPPIHNPNSHRLDYCTPASKLDTKRNSAFLSNTLYTFYIPWWLPGPLGVCRGLPWAPLGSLGLPFAASWFNLGPSSRNLVQSFPLFPFRVCLRARAPLYPWVCLRTWAPLYPWVCSSLSGASMECRVLMELGWDSGNGDDTTQGSPKRFP